MNIQENTQTHQEINLQDRSRLTITGVEDVRSFDDVSIVMKTVFGMIAVDGNGLHITSLSKKTGEIYIEGDIGGVIFFDPDENTGKKKRGLFGGRS